MLLRSSNCWTEGGLLKDIRNTNGISFDRLAAYPRTYLDTAFEKAASCLRSRNPGNNQPESEQLIVYISALKTGNRIRTVDGAVVEVLKETEDRKWILIRYLEDPENPSVVGTEDLCHADELGQLVETQEAAD